MKLEAIIGYASAAGKGASLSTRRSTGKRLFF
jgi:hypothetical protein